MTLHLTFLTHVAIRDRLDRWDNAVRRGADFADDNWRLNVIWSAARDASVSGSTGLEGNPLSADQVDAVLHGSAVEADADHIREVENYNAALDLARTAVRRPDFEWTHEVVHQINSAVMRGLPRDTNGNYRATAADEVRVGIFAGPSPFVVQGLMDELIRWLPQAEQMSTVVRSGLLHLNVIAIHPFNDGNGRTARILAAMILMQDGIRAPELISIEAYLRRNRDEYVQALRTTLGHSYDPDNHPVTDWLDYYTRLSLDRLDVRNLIFEALPTDAGQVYSALADAGNSVDWTPALLAARMGRLRTSGWAAIAGLSPAAARAQLMQMVAADWLVARGRTRGRWYGPSERLAGLPLRVPTMMRNMAAGEALDKFQP